MGVCIQDNRSCGWCGEGDGGRGKNILIFPQLEKEALPSFSVEAAIVQTPGAEAGETFAAFCYVDLSEYIILYKDDR